MSQFLVVRLNSGLVLILNLFFAVFLCVFSFLAHSWNKAAQVLLDHEH